MDDLTRKRMEHNEAVFRSVNDEIEDLAHGGGARDFVCECADATCEDTIRLTREEYRSIRSQPKHYVIVPGHEVPEIEEVVERKPDHFVVDKGA